MNAHNYMYIRMYKVIQLLEYLLPVYNAARTAVASWHCSRLHYTYGV